jgi:hypothetical protein
VLDQVEQASQAGGVAEHRRALVAAALERVPAGAVAELQRADVDDDVGHSVQRPGVLERRLQLDGARLVEFPASTSPAAGSGNVDRKMGSSSIYLRTEFAASLKGEPEWRSEIRID